MGENQQVSRPQPKTSFESYMLDKVDKITDKLEVYDTKFDAIFFCFDRHDEQIEVLKAQDQKILQRLEELRADNKVTQTYYDALKSRVARLELRTVST